MNDWLLARSGVLGSAVLSERYLCTLLGSWTNWKVGQKNKTDGEQNNAWKADKVAYGLNVWTNGFLNTDPQN